MPEFAKYDSFTPAVCRQILSDGIRKKDFTIVIHSIVKVPEKDFAKMAGTSARTISRLKNDQFIPEHAAEVTLSVVRVLRKAEEIFGSQEKAVLWLKRPNTVLNNNIPLSLLSTRFGAEEVMDILTRIEYGVYS